MLVESGQTVFIGGLIKRTSEQTREGVPVLGDIPVLGMLFSNRAQSSVNTELIVLITPYIVDDDLVRLDAGKQARVEEVAEILEEQPRDISRTLDKLDYFEDTFNFSSDEL
jgi:type II secretory pathway component GspD/PulD (secretin)